MPRLIPGKDLTPRQENLVLAAFTFRWTYESQRKHWLGKCPACEQQRRANGLLEINGKSWHEYHVPLESDKEWLQKRAFWFNTAGTELSKNAYCEQFKDGA